MLPLLDRFSLVAYAAVGALALSGLYNAVVHVATPATLAGTTYEQFLVIKLVLVGLLVLLSATHVYGLRPRIAHAQRRIGHDVQATAVVHEGLATLAGRLRLESGVGAAILLATALMTQTLPAPATAPAAPAETPVPPAISTTATAGDLRARLTVAPPAIGTARFTLQVWEKGQVITEDTGATILHLFPADRPNLRATVTPAAHGTRFSGRGSLPTAGTWRADVLVRTATVNAYRTLRFTFTVGPGAGFLEPGQAPERVTLSVSPGRLALPNTVTVSSLPARGVQLVSESLDMHMGRIPYTATPLGGGRWQVRNVYPLMNGRWGLTVQVRSGGGWVALRRFVYQVPLRGTMRLLGAGRAPATATGTTIAPHVVRWARLPYRAAVSFVDNGLIYMPGLPTLIHVGSQNHSVKRAPDGTIWVMDNAGGRVAVLNPRTGHIVARSPVGIAPAHAVFTPDGWRAYVSNLLSNDVSVIDVRARGADLRMPQPGRMACMAPTRQRLWRLEIDDGIRLAYGEVGAGDTQMFQRGHCPRSSARLPMVRAVLRPVPRAPGGTSPAAPAHLLRVAVAHRKGDNPLLAAVGAAHPDA